MQTMQELQARIDEIRTGSVPINTKKNDAWVKGRYNEWAISRQGQGIDIPLTIDNLRPIRVNQVLPLFFTELKKKDHTNYNIKSVYSVFSSIKRIMKDRYFVDLVKDQQFNQFQTIICYITV